MNTDLMQIPRMIDISGVKTNVTLWELDDIIDTAKKFRCICAFAMPVFTPYLVSNLKDEPDIKVGGVVGFPSGADTTSIKTAAAKELLQMGVDELDMVINVGALKSGRLDMVYDDIRAVVEASGGKPVKSILEVCYLTDDEIKRASEIAVKAGVAYVKTGTGWGPKPTTVENIRLIKSTIGDAARIKAAGGIRDLDTVLAMMDAGCSRFGIGVRSILGIMKEVYDRSGKPWPYGNEAGPSAADGAKP
ncbi:MAG TPA: deoxyribose-phosphate aldolase [Candidatus Merdivicinus excrementipullorum]|uniref:Deoxyribose-phosphate aldolase n=1 Tax=Candidatus Merdivicinus excrementipullorum TaxID=2840867 RepID=A0A9D1FNB0_9FIRM|nr:deoxyribose-phosphate aldolase [Candidatus Merdivicinus excrementipullorum]